MRERYQNPVVGEEIKLRLFSYNSNARADIASPNSVTIYFLDPDNISEQNPDGRRLVETISSDSITNLEVGQYFITTNLTSPQYVIGKYLDVWNLTLNNGQVTEIVNCFEILPDLCYFSTAPIVYDFEFKFMPNRLRKGSRRFLVIQIRPNVPHGSDMERYYVNLAIVSPMKIYIEQSDCMPCVPKEEDLRIVVDGDDVDYRERGVAYYLLDTTDMDEGIYNVWFEMEFGECNYISEKNQLQVF